MKIKWRYFITVPFYWLLIAAIWQLPMSRFVLALVIFLLGDLVSYVSGVTAQRDVFKESK